jgi:CheY-like chemotaxis protein
VTPMIVMLVDDDQHALRLYSLYLRGIGCIVVTATNGAQALHQLEALTVPPSVIVLDVRMRNMDGIMTLDRVKADPHTRSIPVILLTGDYIDPNDVPKAAKTLLKPVTPTDLFKEITGIVPPSESLLPTPYRPAGRERTDSSRRGWRMQIDEWASLPVSEQTRYLRLVGDCGGEWWGGGNAAFDDRDAAWRCVEELKETLRVRPRLSFWVG